MLNNELFYSYVEESEKDFLSLEAEFDIEMDKQMLALEYADRLYEIRLKQSDCKVLTESGTYDDLAALYEAAGKEAGERSKNIFKKMFDAIVTFISNIVEKVKNFFTGKKAQQIEAALAENPNAEIQVKKDPNKVLAIVSNGLNQAKKFLKPGFTVTNGDGEKVLSIQKSMVTAVEALAGGVFGAKFVLPAGKKAISTLKDVQFTAKEYRDYDIAKESFKMAGFSDDEAKGYASDIIGGDDQRKIFKNVASFMQTVTKLLNTSLQDVINGAQKVAGNATATAKEVPGKVVDGAKSMADDTVKAVNNYQMYRKAGNDVKTSAKLSKPGKHTNAPVTVTAKSSSTSRASQSYADEEMGESANDFMEQTEMVESVDEILALIDEME